MTQTPATATTPKSFNITLRAGNSRLHLTAKIQKDGRVLTTATTRDADKKSTRGMSAEHPNMETAKAHLTTLAKQAEKLGWSKHVPAAFGRRPDAFTKIPAAPKVA